MEEDAGQAGQVGAQCVVAVDRVYKTSNTIPIKYLSAATELNFENTYLIIKEYDPPTAQQPPLPVPFDMHATAVVVSILRVEGRV